MTALPKPSHRVRARRPIPRRARPAKRRRTSLAAMKRTLWRKFASYVKARDGNVCASCGRSDLAGANWHAGHLFPSNGNSVLRYHPMNVSSQCFHCNIDLGGNGAAYAERFLDLYGIDQFRALSAMAGKLHQWRAPELVEMIAELDKGGADYELWYYRNHAPGWLPGRDQEAGRG